MANVAYQTLHGPRCNGREGHGNTIVCLTAPCQGGHEYHGILKWQQHCMAQHASVVLSTSRREKNRTKSQHPHFLPRIQPIKAPKKRKVPRATVEAHNPVDPSPTSLNLGAPSDDTVLHYGECLAVRIGTSGFQCGTGRCAYAAFSLSRWQIHCIDMHGEPEDASLRESLLKRKADIAILAESQESRKRPRLEEELMHESSSNEAEADDRMDSSSLESTPAPPDEGDGIEFPQPQKGYPERIYKPVYPENKQLAQRFCLYPALKIGVCIPCGVTIPHQKILDHLRSKHPLRGTYTSSIKLEVDQFIQKYASNWGVLGPPNLSVWWCRPPEHVNIVDASRCQSCGFAMATLRSRHRHPCSAASRNGMAVWESIRAFKWGLTPHCVPVTPFSTNVQGFKSHSALDDLFKYTDDLDTVADSGEQACDLDPFNDNCGFSAFKATLGDSEKGPMLRYAKVRLSNARFKDYVNQLDGVMANLQAVLDVRVELRSIMAKSRESVYRDSLRKVQQPRRYIRIAVAFLLFVLDTWRFRPSERHYFITQKHRRALQAFEAADHAEKLNLLTDMLRVFWLDSLYQVNGDIEAMQAEEESNSTLDVRTHDQVAKNKKMSVEEAYDKSDHAIYAEGSQPSDDEEDEEEDDKEDEEEDNEEEDDEYENDNGLSDDFVQGGSDSGSELDSDDDAISAETPSNEQGEGVGGASAHQCFENAYTVPPRTQNANECHPFQAWVILFNMEGCNFSADPRKVQACLSGVQWVARMVGFEEGLRKSNNNKLDNSHLLKRVLEDITRIWLSEEKSTVFSWCRWLLHESSRHGGRIVGLGTIHELSDTTFAISGRTIHVPAFQAMIAELVKQTEVAFDNLLTHWGVTVDDLEIPTRFEDRVDSRRQGQWFGHLESQTRATRDMVNRTRRRIRAAMLANGSLIIEGHQTWSPDKIEAMVDATSHFMRHLQATCASVGGQPSRIKELSKLRFVTGNRERNLYDFDGDMVFCTKYDKTTWISGFDKLIPHVYPVRLSVILRRYLVYVRPLEYQLGTLCAVADEAKLSMCRYQLFSFFGRSIGTPHFSEFIMEFTASKLGIEPGLRALDFRHALIHICRRHVFKQSKVKKRQQFADLQAGHSSETARNVYAIPAKPCPTDPRFFLEFQEICYMHHEFFDLRTVDDADINLETLIERIGDQTLKKVESCVENALRIFMANVEKKLEAKITTVVGLEIRKAFKSLGRP